MSAIRRGNRSPEPLVAVALTYAIVALVFFGAGYLIGPLVR